MKEKVKKIMRSLIGGILLFTTKVMAMDSFDIAQPMYGITKPESKTVISLNVLKIIGIIFIPIVLLMGAIIYVRKNKDNEDKKKSVKIVKNIYQSVIILIVGSIILFGIFIVTFKYLH